MKSLLLTQLKSLLVTFLTKAIVKLPLNFLGGGVVTWIIRKVGMELVDKIIDYTKRDFNKHSRRIASKKIKNIIKDIKGRNKSLTQLKHARELQKLFLVGNRSLKK